MSAAHDERFARAKAAFVEGLAQLEAGRFAAAEAAFERSRALLPQRLSTLVNLAVARLALGRGEAALEAADAALALAPDDADARLQRASALASLGRRDEALAAFDALLAAAPAHATAWSRRGQLLRELGRFAEAADAFGAALAHGGDDELNRWYLAAVGGAAARAPACRPAPAQAQSAAPVHAPARYVESLFDAYADDFDAHLVGTLGYRGPALLLDGLARAAPPPAGSPSRVRSALDLGCGTGLCGPGLRPLAERLTGVDLSAQMLERARTLGVYDRLVRADLHAHLEGTGERHAIVLCADVFIYVGALERAFAGVRRVLERGGRFAFTAEAADDDDAGCVLQPSLRYAHGQAHLRRLAAAHGFEVASAWRAPMRSDAPQAVCMVLRG